ncbi:MAG: YidB family protein [Pseudomonadota bacterium]|nr:YidB family protein [Pseudomonadota bacterium]
MFEVLIREAGARFGLGDKALSVAQMLLAYMTNKDTGGLAGFLEKFKSAGLGPIVQSWLGGGPGAQPISNSQVETVLGASGGLLSMITGQLGVNRDNVTSAIGYLVPAIVGKLTPGGSLPSSLPPEIAALAATGQNLLDTPAMATAEAPSAGNVMKWLPWVILAAAALIGLSYCGTNKTAEQPATSVPAPVEAPASVPAPATSGSDAAPQAPASEPASEPASAASAAAVAVDEPAGSAVVNLIDANTMPALKVYFDSGKADVHADFAAKSTELVDYMKANADVKAIISGFNDPTGDPVANAELSKNRAQAVQAALVAAGISQDRTELEKPAETTGTAATNAASRRVEVVLRK